MKQATLFLLLLFLFSSCNEGEAVFKITSKNFGKNAVVDLLDLKTGKALAVENLGNETTTLKVNLIEPQYARLKVTDSNGGREFLIYLGKGRYELLADQKALLKYPVKESTVSHEKELIDYYQIKEQTTKSVTESFEQSKIDFDKSTPNDVLEKSQIMSEWAVKKVMVDLEAIKVFASKYPESESVLIILDQLGLVESQATTYTSIFKSLSSTVQESKAGKSLWKEITASTQMVEGSEIPAIEGKNPNNEAFQANKVMKKTNVFICWTTYDSKSRKQNPILVALYNQFRDKNIEFIGISYDKNRKWWTDVIKDDHLSWPQYADLKGAKSANAKALSNLRIPYILITDQKGKILRADVLLENLETNLLDYVNSK